MIIDNISNLYIFYKLYLFCLWTNYNILNQFIITFLIVNGTKCKGTLYGSEHPCKCIEQSSKPLHLKVFNTLFPPVHSSRLPDLGLCVWRKNHEPKSSAKNSVTIDSAVWSDNRTPLLPIFLFTNYFVVFVGKQASIV